MFAMGSLQSFAQTTGSYYVGIQALPLMAVKSIGKSQPPNLGRILSFTENVSSVNILIEIWALSRTGQQSGISDGERRETEKAATFRYLWDGSLGS